MLEAILNLVDWQWRDAQTLWFVFLPIILWLFLIFKKHQQINQYADNHLLPWVRVEQVLHVKNARGGYLGSVFHKFKGLFNALLMLSIAWICIIIALAGPRSAVPSPEEHHRAGVDIMLVLDLSLSMNAQDVKPSRFLFTRSLIESLSSRLEANDRLALLAYAGQPHLVSPLSFDRTLFQHYLSLLRPNMLPTKGSQIKPMLIYGEQHLQQTAGKAKVLVVFTDGEPKNFVEQDEPNSFMDLSNSDVKIILVGVGERSRVKIPDAEHRTGYLHHRGLLVSTRLEEPFLQALAGRLNGVYLKANSSQQFMKLLVDEITVESEKRTFQTNNTVWQDHSMPFIWIAFFALLYAFYPVKLIGRALPVLMVGLLFNFMPQASYAEPRKAQIEQQAYEAFTNQNYDEAQQLYDGLDDFNGWFGAGSAAYKMEDYESAVQYFRQSALLGLTVENRSDALFNLGNAYYRANLLKQAVLSYQQALNYLPNNAKTQHNLALAQQRRKVEKGQQQDHEQGDGKGDGSQSRDDEGAFYGGQKPGESAGKGVAGDSDEGKKQGKDFILPEERNDSDFTLNKASRVKLNQIGNAIVDQQKRIKRMEKFEQNMQQVQDNQRQLLIGIFEREEGYQATQESRHDIQGVKPW